MEKTFILPGVTESQNVWDRMHWSGRHRIRDAWFWTVMSVCGRNDLKVPPARVSICRVSNRLIDLQNISAPTKPLLDAFVEYGWLRGDGPMDVLEFSVSQRKCEGREVPHMRVTLRYAEQPPW